jgi:[ribosomal protein S5]-alanine N-acetyltransferase
MDILYSPRLMLERFAFSDADDLFRIRSDAEAMEYWDWPADDAIEETRKIAQIMLDDMRGGASKIWTARRTANNGFAGVIDLSEIDGDEADLGFMVPRDLWGQGYAFEASSLVVAYAWSLGLTRLRARTHCGNARSNHLLEKLGFATYETREMEVRPGVTKRCQFFVLSRADAPQGSSSLSQ